MTSEVFKKVFERKKYFSVIEAVNNGGVSGFTRKECPPLCID